MVRQDNQTVRFDWGQEVAVCSDFKWAFLFGDCEHEVEKVTGGLRLTMAYDIFLGPSRNEIGTAINPKTSLDTALQAAIKDLEGFAPGGCTLAFGLKHAYPNSGGQFLENLGAHLKGPDAALLQAVKALRLPVSFKAVFPRPEYNEHNYKTPVEYARALDGHRRTNVKSTRERHGLQKHKVRPPSLRPRFCWSDKEHLLIFRSFYPMILMVLTMPSSTTLVETVAGILFVGSTPTWRQKNHPPLESWSGSTTRLVMPSQTGLPSMETM